MWKFIKNLFAKKNKKDRTYNYISGSYRTGRVRSKRSFVEDDDTNMNLLTTAATMSTMQDNDSPAQSPDFSGFGGGESGGGGADRGWDAPSDNSSSSDYSSGSSDTSCSDLGSSSDFSSGGSDMGSCSDS